MVQPNSAKCGFQVSIGFHCNKNCYQFLYWVVICKYTEKRGTFLLLGCDTVLPDKCLLTSIRTVVSVFRVWQSMKCSQCR